MLLQRTKYDTESDEINKTETKVAIPSEYFMRIPSHDEDIFYALLSLIMHERSSYNSGHY